MNSSSPTFSAGTPLTLLAHDTPHARWHLRKTFAPVSKIGNLLTRRQRLDVGITQDSDDAVQELNTRFQRAGVGYRFENQRIIRIDSELVHTGVVQPALQFLSLKGFERPRDEFMDAHSHYRKGKLEAAIVSAHCAFESTMKTIFHKKGWSFENQHTVSMLLKTARKKGLFPSYTERPFQQLYATLKSGLPEIRNNEGAHGRGPVSTSTPDYIAAYALHLAAAAILFLGRAFEHNDR